MLPHALLYCTCKNNALEAFKGNTGNDITLLTVLYCINYPLTYSALYRAMCYYKNGMNLNVYNRALRHGVAAGHITRQSVGVNVHYAITHAGRYRIMSINQHLDNIVKQEIIKYGNGLPE